MQELHEVVLRYLSDRRVILCLNCRCTLWASQESDFAEVLPWNQFADESLLQQLVLDETLAFSLRNYEKIEGRFTLLNFYLLRLAHHKFNLLNHVVFNVGVEGEY